MDENGYPLIMYYDITNQTLKLAYYDGTTPVDTMDYANWNIQTVFDAGDPNKSFVGKYVTMKIDATGSIHAACSRTASGSLVYLYAPDADGSDYDFAQSVEIDSEGAVGTWADITLNGTTPYISYLNNSMIGTFDGLKLAYYDTGLSQWEHEIAPLTSGIYDKRTSIEFHPDPGADKWKAAVGYGGDNFHIVYLKPEPALP